MGSATKSRRGTLHKKPGAAVPFKRSRVSKGIPRALQNCVADGFLIEQPVVHGCKMRCETAPGNLLGCFLLKARMEKTKQGEHANGTSTEVDDVRSPIFIDMSAHAFRTEPRNVEIVVLDDCKSSGLPELKLNKNALCTAGKD